MSEYFFSLHMILTDCIWTDGGWGAEVVKNLANEENQ